jgi:hypothetical protein
MCRPKQTRAHLSPTKLQQSFTWRKSQASLTHTIESQPCVVNEWSWQLGVRKKCSFVKLFSFFKQGLAPNGSIGEVCLCMFNATCEIKGYYLVCYEIIEH